MRLRLAFASLCLGGALCGGGALPAFADGLAGPYLAGRVASINSDYKAASDYFTRAIQSDPANPSLMESAVIAWIGIGNFDQAIPIAQAMSATGHKSRLADLAVLAGLVKSGDFAATQAALDQGRNAGPLVDGLLHAWTKVGAGQMADASADFDKVSAERGLAPFALYHKALALALVGDFEGADAIFAGQQSGPIRATRRSIIAHAQILSQLERNADAIRLLDQTLGKDPQDTVIASLRADLEAGKSVPFTAVASPVDGIAEVFLAIGSALSEEVDQTDHSAPIDSLMYARAAAYLRPDLTEAVLLAANILVRQEQNDLAIEAYDLVPQESPEHIIAALGRADALIAAGRNDAAIEALQQLAKSEPDQIEVWAGLGDTLRRNDRFDEGITAYDHAVGLIKGPAKGYWALYYARAICLERAKQWEKAEADFRMALKLSPDQPDVLNYLGYSYLEKNQNLDEALSMIERAARARPDSGAISDSLAWAYYRLGRYPEAEKEIERAIQLMPVDPVLNDHLGDIYWAVGRKLEADFQWRRALSFKPATEEEAKRIRRKIEVGLDAVLQEEGAKPLAVTNDGG